MSVPTVAIAVVASTLMVGLAVQPLLLRQLAQWGSFDVPNARSSHKVAVVRGGGLGVATAMIVGWSLLLPNRHLVGLGLSVLAACLVGFAEDLRGIRVRTRLAAQMLCMMPLLAVASSGFDALWLALPLGGLFLVGAINSVNFMDGVNGITAGFGIAVGCSSALLFGSLSQPTLAIASLVMGAACMSFLPYNAGRARLFLGDSGSYTVGAAVGGLCLLTWVSGAGLESAISPLAIYIADTATVLVRRLRAGDRIGEAHRMHVYQRLTDLGWSHQKVAVFVSVLTLICGVTGWIGMRGGGVRAIADLLIVAIALLYLSSPRVVGRNRKPGVAR